MFQGFEACHFCTFSDIINIMTAAVRQTVIVQPGGVVHLASPELQEGTEAEVIVLVPASPQPQRRLAAFRALQQSLALTPDVAEQWIREAAAEREAFGPT
jgi:hypothetical protein